MKFITNRQEIARLMNIEDVPAIRMDVSKCMRGYEHCYKGGIVKIACPSKRYPDMTHNCTIEMFGDEHGNSDKHDTPWLYERIKFGGEMIGLTASFGYSDVMELVKWNNARTIKAGDIVLVVFDRGDACFIRKMRVGAHVDPFCTTVATLEDVDD